MTAPDITKRLTENAAAMWEANHVAAWRVMLDAADLIESLRAEINASWGVYGTSVTGSDDVT